MTLKDTDPGVIVQAPGDSPGRMIAVARESHNISPADLAIRLRLDVKVVKALERDDFESLPASMFVKGYLRSIAKELGIDAAKILDAYALHASEEPPALADFSSRPPAQIGINSAIIKFATYSLITILLVLIASWWRSNYAGLTQERSTLPAEEIPVNEDAAEPLPYDFAIVEHDDSTWQAPQPEYTAADTDAPQEASAGAMPEPMLGEHTVRITTTSEAWIEIYDRAGARLYFGMAKAPRPVEVTGYDYYRLVLGNTDSIELQVDGDRVDLGPYSVQGVAQLELGVIGGTAAATE
jgi:cytoskeleton protein RodZ